MDIIVFYGARSSEKDQEHDTSGSKKVTASKSRIVQATSYWYLISRVFNFAFFAIVKKSRN